MTTRRFGEKLRSLRKQRGMSQRKLAEIFGLKGHVFIHRLETGEKQPNVEHALKLARLFGVSLDDLLLDERDVE